jgi:hypothetical protein
MYHIIFAAGFLKDYRNRTDGLRALANHDLLLLVAGRERQEAERFGRLCGASEKDKAWEPNRELTIPQGATRVGLRLVALMPAGRRSIPKRASENNIAGCSVAIA